MCSGDCWIPTHIFFVSHQGFSQKYWFDKSEILNQFERYKADFSPPFSNSQIYLISVSASYVETKCMIAHIYLHVTVRNETFLI